MSSFPCPRILFYFTIVLFQNLSLDVDDKAKMEGFIQHNGDLLKMVQLSPFSVYKQPHTFYEHTINMLAVDLEVKRSGDASRCPLESSYKELKKENFPKEMLQEIVERAAKKSEHAKKAQKKIKDFFLPSPRIQSGHEEVITEPEVLIEEGQAMTFEDSESNSNPANPVSQVDKEGG